MQININTKPMSYWQNTYSLLVIYPKPSDTILKT